MESSWVVTGIGFLIGLLGISAFALMRIEKAATETRDLLRTWRDEQVQERENERIMRFHERARHTHLENMRRQSLSRAAATESLSMRTAREENA